MSSSKDGNTKLPANAEQEYSFEDSSFLIEDECIDIPDGFHYTISLHGIAPELMGDPSYRRGMVLVAIGERLIAQCKQRSISPRVYIRNLQVALEHKRLQAMVKRGGTRLSENE